MTIKIEVVKVRRNCPAFNEGNIILFEKSMIIPKTELQGCMSAYTTITMNVGRVKTENPLFVSCLDAGLTAEGCGNVIFKIAREKDG